MKDLEISVKYIQKVFSQSLKEQTGNTVNCIETWTVIDKITEQNIKRTLKKLTVAFFLHTVLSSENN